jgi:hypothetical protein
MRGFSSGRSDLKLGIYRSGLVAKGGHSLTLMRYIYQQADKLIVWLQKAAQKRFELIVLLYHTKDFKATDLRDKIYISNFSGISFDVNHHKLCPVLFVHRVTKIVKLYEKIGLIQKSTRLRKEPMKSTVYRPIHAPNAQIVITMPSLSV